MASYSDDHATYAQEQTSGDRSHDTSRLDRNDPLLTTFFNADRIDTETSNRLFLDLAQALQNHDGAQNPLMANMIETLLAEAQSSGNSQGGVNQEFLDTLDRVSKKSLKADDSCSICATPYLDDQYPLVVSLRCHHNFDLECITPWLKLHTTCPICRADVQKRKIEIPDDSEEEYDETYG